jgi:hypothetical protein
MTTALLVQAPTGRMEMTTTEAVVIVCMILSLLVVAFWMRWRR